MKNNWLHENTPPIIAIGYTAFSFIVYILVLTKVITASENVAFLIINSITNIVMLIVGYYFGSSAGSKAKSEELNKVREGVEL